MSGLTEIVVAGAGAIALILVERYRSRRKPTAAAPPARAEHLRVRTDLARLFVEGQEVGDMRLHVQPVASLHLPSGRIVACDPLVFPETEPFARAVKPGAYPVDVSVAQLPDQQRIAAMRITFAPGTPVRFEPAGAYGNDTGLGCFMDEVTAKLLEQAMERVEDSYFDDVLHREMGDRDWVDHHPARDEHNVVIAHSGWGDGFYTSHWGLDEAGEPLWLVTDFEVA